MSSHAERKPPLFLLMAAGQARRFGARKQLAVLNDGQTLLDTVYQRIISVSTSAQIVLSPDHCDLIEHCQARGMPHWIAPYPPPTLAQSIGLAVAAHRHHSGWIIALADMPGIQSATYYSVLQAMRSERIAVPINRGGRQGHPVGFGAHYGAELAQLADQPAAHADADHSGALPTNAKADANHASNAQRDQGARTIVQRHASRIARICCDDPGIVLDIDRPSDIKHHHQAATTTSDDTL